jgi:uncharacterized protein
MPINYSKVSHGAMALRFTAVALALATLTGGCFRLSRNAPVVQRYALTTPSATRADAGAAPGATGSGSDGLRLGVRRVQLASYLAVPDVMVRRGPNRLVSTEFHRWGEPLNESLNRVVAGHLANTPTVAAVDVAPWAPRTRHDLLLQLQVHRFEGVTDDGGGGGRAHLHVAWDLVRPYDGTVVARGTTERRDDRWAAGDYAALVRALDAGLAGVAQDIARCAARLPRDAMVASPVGSANAAAAGSTRPPAGRAAAGATGGERTTTAGATTVSTRADSPAPLVCEPAASGTP